MKLSPTIEEALTLETASSQSMESLSWPNMVSTRSARTVS
jgi:hypothetical protein